MSVWRCVYAGILTERLRSGLSEAERLRLETHVEDCGPCGEDARMLGVLGMLVDTLPAQGMSRRARDRVLAAALDAGAMPSVHAPRQSGAAFLVGGGLVAAAAMAMLWLLLGGHRHSAPTARSRPIITIERSPAGGAAAASELLWGDLEVSQGRAIEVGGPVPSLAALRTRNGARFRLGHAELMLTPGSAVRWDPTTDSVALQSGKATVDVSPRQSRRFRARTRDFMVEVMGTRFEVDARGVRVFEGTVRVLTPDGQVRVAALEAGSEWHYRSIESEIRSLLGQAREHLAQGRVHAARGVLDRMRAADLTTRQSAEADSLLAECALVAGRHDEAAQRYEQVARRYPRLTAGETALFAAARLRARAGQADRARTLLRRYLDQYPSGRFSEQAQDKLRELEP